MLSHPCTRLHELLTELPRLGADFSPEDVPTSGIYVMFEHGERAHGTERIVRVGTHRGDSNLRHRLAEHFHKANKDRSIFRKHVGRCLLAARDDPFLAQWEIDLTTRAARERHGHGIDRDRLLAIEEEVTDYLGQNLSFVALPVEDKQDRVAVERGLLATVASCKECHASPGWVGRFHPNPAIPRHGLWNVQGLTGQPLATEDVKDLLDSVSGVKPAGLRI